jgi:hypothetical protein
MTLISLLDRSAVSMWHRASWFKGAELKGNCLLIPGDAGEAQFVERMWGATFRQHQSDLVIQRKPEAVQPSRPNPGYNTKLWKRAPYGTPPAKDLLD